MKIVALDDQKEAYTVTEEDVVGSEEIRFCLKREMEQAG